MGTKICSKCKDEKQIDEFGKDSSRKDGYSYLCKICLINKSRLYKKNNHDKILNGYKEYREKNNEKIKNSRKEYVKNNQEKISEYKKQYYLINKDYFLKWEKNKRDIDELFKLSGNVRKRLNKFFKVKNFKKSNKTIDIVGCTPQELKTHLERQFQDGMSWDNYGFYGWHIDHIIPLSSAQNEEEIYKLCHYTNLQPLWAKDNLSKGDKLL